MSSSVILTGFMGTGKSTIGKRLASKLGWRFIDTDEQIVKVAGKSVDRIFADDGEARFRALERDAIAALAESSIRCPRCGESEHLVVSTGGGAIADASNLSAMRRAGAIVCLSARPDVIAARVSRNAARRPKLLEGGKPLVERITDLLAARSEAYAQADFTVDTSDMTIEAAVDRIIAELQAGGAISCRPSA